MSDFDGNIDPPASWADVPSLSTEAAALGGTGGPMNAQAVALVKRVKQLRDEKASLDDLAVVEGVASAAADAAAAATATANDAASTASGLAASIATANSNASAAVAAADAAQDDVDDLRGEGRPASMVISYDGNGRVSGLAETANGDPRTTTITYNADGTVNTVAVTYRGVTRTETYSYSGGRCTGYTAVEV